MLFFTSQAPTGVSVPSTFRDKGNTTDIPTAPSDSCITVIPQDITQSHRIFKSGFPYIAAAQAKKQDINTCGYVDISDAEVHTSFIQTPPVTGVTFHNNLSESAQTTATKLGLSREVINRRTFYKGTITQDQAIGLLREGAEPDAYLPYGVTNISGLVTFYTLRRLAFFAIQAFPEALDVEHINALYDYVGPNPIYHYKQHPRWTVSIPGYKLKRSGHMCPYFDGMTLPDKNFVLSVIQNLELTRLLGKDEPAVANALSALTKGWRSLCFTAQGKILSHIFQCIDIALRANLRVIALRNSSDSYVGCALLGQTSILKGAKLHKVEIGTSLLKTVQSLDRHAEGLIKLVDLINELDEDEEAPKYAPAMFTSPRRINTILVKLKITPAKRMELREALNLLEFPQTFWHAKDQKKMELVLNMIRTGTLPSEDEPMPYLTDLIFTSNVTQRILSGYGDRAPCFSLTEGTRSISLIKNTKAPGNQDRMENLSLKKNGISHLPVYVLPTQQAATAWDEIRKHAVLHIRERSGKPEGAFQMYPAHLAVAQVYLQSLAKYIKPAEPKGKKRKASDGEKGDDLDDADLRRIVKKLKSQGDGVNQLLTLLGREELTSGPSTGGAGDEMDEE